MRCHSLADIVTDSGELITPHGHYVSDSLPPPDDSPFAAGGPLNWPDGCKSEASTFVLANANSSLKIYNSKFQHMSLRAK